MAAHQTTVPEGVAVPKPGPGRPPACAAPLREVRFPRFALPPDACDSHLHILGPSENFPYVEDRVYTPPDCLLGDYQALQDCLGVSRCVLVQASVYGSDNRVLLQALEALGNAARGVAVLRGDEPEEKLQAMHRLGVRGARVNLVDVKTPGAALPLAHLQRMSEVLAPLGWHLELLVHVDQHPDLDTQLGDLGVPLVFGHMGYLSKDVRNFRCPGMRAMLDLMRAGRAWAKVTAPYRLDAPPVYGKAADIAQWLAIGCADRLVWGSDWPHVMVKTDMPHDADLLDLVAAWLPDPAQQQALFVSNPARLYGWA